MKNHFTLRIVLFLFVLQLGCRKFDYQYGIVCEFPPFALAGGEKATLVITDLANNELAVLDLTGFNGNVSESFTLNLKHPVETFNAHFIVESLPIPDLQGNAQIYSHLGLKNSGSFRFLPDQFRLPPPAPAKRVLLNLGPFNESWNLRVPGATVIEKPHLVDRLLEVSLLEKQSLMMLDVDPNNGETIQFFLPWEAMQDTMRIDRSKFTKYTKTMRYDLKSEPGKYAGVYLVAPDQQAFVCLEDYDQDNICEIPDGIPTDWKPYYKAGFGSVYLEKLGKNQNDITKLAPSVKTYSKSYESGLLKVECDPKVDWLRIGTYYIDSPMGGRYLGWTIEGKPDVFEHVELPDLSAYVSGGREIFGNLFKDGRISYTMFYSEEFDYEDMKIGLPWKTAGLFSLGQKGYEIVNE